MTLSQSDMERVYCDAIPSLRRTNASEAKGMCPFHDDQHPSFSVNLEKGLWCCHSGCGGGNIFQFVARHQGVQIKDVDQIIERRLR